MANNHLYIKNIEENKRYFEEEILYQKDRYNEFIMTGLRLKRGLDIFALGEHYAQFILKESVRLREQGQLVLDDTRLFIPEKYRFQADGIASELFDTD